MSVGVRLKTAIEEAVERGDKTKVAHLFDETRNNIVAQLKGAPVADFSKILRPARSLFKRKFTPEGTDVTNSWLRFGAATLVRLARA